MSTAAGVLAAFYRQHNPELEARVEDVLTQYPGAEGWIALSAKLKDRYKEAPPIPAAMVPHSEGAALFSALRPSRVDVDAGRGAG